MLFRIPMPDRVDRGSSELPEQGEEGYLLLTVLVLVFLILLALSVAAPRVAKEIQRDKELEAMQRGLQYKRAIKLYYKKFGAYPTDIKQLENTNEVRYLRKRYIDPLTGKDDWRIIHQGEAKVKPTGWFGQPLQTGLSSQSTGPGLSGSGTSGSGSGTTGSTGGSTSGSTDTTGLPMASGGDSTTGQGSGIGSGSGAGFGSGSGSSGPFGSGSSSGPFGPGNSSGPGSSTGGPGTGTNGPGTSGFGTGNAGYGGGSFGGGPIVGVGVPGDKQAIIEYRKQKKYSQWEFVYDPQEESVMGMGGGNALNGANTNGAGSNSNGAFGGGSNPSNSGGFGSGPTFGSGTTGSSGTGSNGSGSGSTGSGNGSVGSAPQPQ
jgi:type II secretory pathway pseudopilin PulG